MNIRKVPLHLLRPYENNVKDHPVKQLEAITNSIKEFGFRQPIVIDKNNVIVAGHARYEAAAALGFDEVPCELAHDLTDEQINAYRILDNEIAKQGTTNISALQTELDKLHNFDFSPFNIELPNFEEVTTGLTDEDAVPDVSSETIAKPGDVWILGNHRLMCGDSTNPLHVELLLDKHNPNLMVTDPPYGVNYDPEWRVEAGVQKRSFNNGLVSNDSRSDWSDAYSLFTGNIIYIWHDGKVSHNIASHLINCDFEIKYLIIWNKDLAVFGRGDYHHKHEPCLYAVKKGCSHNWQGDRKQNTVWDIPTIHSFKNGKNSEEWGLTGHATQKPLECMSRPIQNNTKPGEYVYDPFGGSGTTIIACEKLNRNCLMMELDPKYCDVIIKRWEDYTGKKACLDESSKT
jgi:DNA modification methylase